MEKTSKTPLTVEEMDDAIQWYCKGGIDYDDSRCCRSEKCEIEDICTKIYGDFGTRNPEATREAFEIINKTCEAEPSDKAKLHASICDELNKIFIKKNADYGDSFHLSYLDEGMAMPRIRIGDKYNRFRTLTKGNEANVKDESIRDTLLDLANYAILTVMELDGGENDG